MSCGTPALPSLARCHDGSPLTELVNLEATGRDCDRSLELCRFFEVTLPHPSRGRWKRVGPGWTLESNASVNGARDDRRDRSVAVV